MYRKIILILCLINILIMTPAVRAKSFLQNKNEEEQQLLNKKMSLYLKTSAVTGVPWTILAACDHFDTLTRSRQHLTDGKSHLIGLYYSDSEWAGLLNPNKNAKDPLSIAFFHGSGMDGNGDGKADRNNPEDVLYTFAKQLSAEGVDERSYKIALWKRYHRDQTIQIISQLSHLYAYFHTMKLTGHAFPVPTNWNYSFHSTWGASRGWGGRRIHEGTDIFAGYGTPVRATGYGTIETVGWNRFGGYRVGIRDADFIYHYYAHLSGFKKGIYKGEIVKPGDIIGSVGSTGYGPKGTQGKFPPHLHYGIYIDNGRTEYAIDPYPALRRYEHLGK